MLFKAKAQHGWLVHKLRGSLLMNLTRQPNTEGCAIDQFRGRYEFLSNFYPALIHYDGIIYPSSEHAYQAAKCLDDATITATPECWETGLELKFAIAAEPSSGKAKHMGKLLPLRPDWEQVKLDIMLQIVTLKFKDEHLAAMLKRTAPCTLIEGNNWGDTYWGVDVAKGGLNMLGKVLMHVRDNL